MAVSAHEYVNYARMAMISLTITKLSVTGYLEIVQELKQSGLVLEKDFTWSYARGNSDLNPLLTSSCTLTFNDDRNATYFMLKWSHLLI